MLGVRGLQRSRVRRRRDPAAQVRRRAQAAAPAAEQHQLSFGADAKVRGGREEAQMRRGGCEDGGFVDRRPREEGEKEEERLGGACTLAAWVLDDESVLCISRRWGLDDIRDTV